MIYWGVYPLRRKLRLALAGAAEQLDLFLALVDDGLRAGSQQLAGIEALALLRCIAIMLSVMPRM